MPEPYAHYEDYPYPDAESMARRAPMRDWRTDNAPRRDNWEQWFPGEPYGKRKSVLVVGCGTTEAVIVANQEPMLIVFGIEPSEASYRIACENASALGLRNLELCNAALEDYALTRGVVGDPPFDAVICSGVLHHVPDAFNFVRTLRNLTVIGGPVSVMVYGDKERGFVPDFAAMLRMLGAQPDGEGVAFTRYLLGQLPLIHPARMFTGRTDNTDAQIADLWLHRYFRQYSAPELFLLMEGGGFRYRRWMNTAAVSARILLDLPSRFEKFREAYMRLPTAAQLEVGQIINHADAKITVMFEAA